RYRANLRRNGEYTYRRTHNGNWSPTYHASLARQRVARPFTPWNVWRDACGQRGLAMKAAIIAGCVVLSVSFGASGAHAGAYPKPIRPNLIYFNYLPPPEYDKPFTGKLLIRRFETEEEIVEVCKGSSKVACAARSVDGSTCHLFIAGDRVIKSHHTTWLFVLRHE